MKKAFLTLALGAMIFGSVARADDPDRKPIQQKRPPNAMVRLIYFIFGK